MKIIGRLGTLLLVLGIAILLNVQSANSQITVQAGIFASGSDITVKAKASGGSLSGLPLTGSTLTMRYSSTYAISLSAPTTTLGYVLDSTVTSGGFVYKIYSTAANVVSTFNNGTEVTLFTVTVSGSAGTGTFAVINDAVTSAYNGDWYFEYNGTDYTNTSTPFYQGSVSNVPLPIQLAKSSAVAINDKDVEVSWHTVSETNNYGFEIERKRGQRSDVGGQNAGWAKVAFVEGHGTTLQPQSYSYVDRNLIFGKYFYRIKQIDLDGKAQLFPEMEVNVGVGPDKFVLGQNYPNPFNPSTLIDFAVPKTGRAVLKVYNILGQEVATLFDGEAEVGKVYTVSFPPARGNSFGGDTTSPASGTYFYVLRSAGKSETKRMLLLK